MPRPLSIIEAPSILGLRPTGVEDLPQALRANHLHARLGLPRVSAVAPLAYDPERDRETGMLNGPAIVEYSQRLANEVGDAIERGERPLVLGGDCTILLGNLLALARRGRYGLIFLDGHSDFYQPEANVNGEAASSELAFATGRGPASLTSFDGHRPLVHDEHVVAIGTRDEEEARRFGSQLLPPTIRQYDLSSVRQIGAARVMQESLDLLSASDLDGFWVHFDADALGDEIMPAVDYRLPGGLSWSEAEDLLARACASESMAGIDLTIFNPRLDPDGRLAAALVDLLTRALTRSPLTEPRSVDA